MPFNGSNTFTPARDFEQDATNGVPFDATKFMEVIDDVAAGLTTARQRTEEVRTEILGTVNDTSLDTIRELADRVKAEAAKIVALTAFEIFPPSQTITAPQGVAVFGQMQAIGATAPVTWSATGLPPGYTLSSAGVWSGTATTAGTYTGTVTATDAESLTRSVKYTWIIGAAVSEIAIHPPSQTITGVAVGSPVYGQMQAIGATGTVTWSATGLPPGYTLSSSGVWSGTATTAGTYTGVVTGSDSGTGASATAYYTWIIAASGAVTAGTGTPFTGDAPDVTAPTVMAITTTSLPPLYRTTSVDTTLAASPATAPIEWEVTAGAMPAGLTLATDGDITGTPTTEGAYSVTITATDSSTPARESTRTYTGVVHPPLAITTTLPAQIIQGTAQSYYLGVNIAGTHTWDVSAGSLPTGLTLSAGGVLSGTPTTAQSVTPTIRATETVSGAIATRAYTIAVIVAPPLDFSPSGTIATIPQYGALATDYLQASGGTGTYSVSLSTYPAGHDIALDDDLIASGRWRITAPAFRFNTPGTYNVASILSDGTTPVVKTNQIVVTASPITVAVTGLEDELFVGTAMSSATATATGATGAVTWSLIDAPAGISINSSTGVITGTPTTAGQSTMIIVATDADSNVGARFVFMDVEPEMKIAHFAVATSGSTVTLSSYTQSANPVAGSVSGNTLTLTDAGDYLIEGILYNSSGTVNLVIDSSHAYVAETATTASHTVVNVRYPRFGVSAGGTIVFTTGSSPSGALAGRLTVRKLS